MATYQQQKQRILQLFEQAIAFAKLHKYPDTFKHLEDDQKRLAKEKLLVVVCGEFKQGKSSLLNALLNETGLFPVDIEVTTNLVSTITYGKEEKIIVVLGEQGKETVKQIKRDEIPDYVTEQRNARNAKKAKMLVMESPNPQLKEGLVLVDTPGIGSLNTEHTAITYAFIPNADAILFVTDSLKPLTTEELDFIKKRILPHSQNIIFAITKIDALNESDRDIFLENNQEKLAETLDCSASQITLIPVSSRAKLDYLEYQELTDLKHSNFEELEKQIWQLISEQRGQTFLLSALDSLNQCIGEMKAPMQVAWESNQQKTKQELDQLEDQLREIQENLQALLNKNAEWRTLLTHELQDIQADIQNKFQKEFSHIRYQSNEYLDDSRLLNTPKQIADLLEVDIDGLMSKLSKDLNECAAHLYARLENITGLNLNRLEVGLNERQKISFSDEGISVKKSSLVDKSLSATRNAMFTSTAGSIVGGLLGAAAGAVFGFFVGGGVGAIPGAAAGAQWGSGLGLIGGAAKGAKDGLDQLQEKDQVLLRREITKKITLFIGDSQLVCQQTLGKSVTALERAMGDEFTAQIKRQKDGWERTLRSLQESRKLSQAKAVEQSKQLQIPLQQLTQLQTNIEQLTQLVIEQPITTPPIQTSSPPTSKQPVKAATIINKDYGDWADG